MYRDRNEMINHMINEWSILSQRNIPKQTCVRKEIYWEPGIVRILQQ